MSLIVKDASLKKFYRWVLDRQKFFKNQIKIFEGRGEMHNAAECHIRLMQLKEDATELRELDQQLSK